MTPPEPTATSTATGSAVPLSTMIDLGSDCTADVHHTGGSGSCERAANAVYQPAAVVLCQERCMTTVPHEGLGRGRHATCDRQHPPRHTPRSVVGRRSRQRAGCGSCVLWSHLDDPETRSRYQPTDSRLVINMPHAGHAHAANLFMTPRRGPDIDPERRRPRRQRRRLSELLRFERPGRTVSAALTPQPVVMQRRSIMQFPPDRPSGDLGSTMQRS